MAAGCGGDLGEDGFSGAQQLFAFLRPFLAKARIEAHQQPLAGKLGTDDFRHLVRLQFVDVKCSRDFTVVWFFEQLADVGVAKRRDPIQCHRQQILADARRGNHAAVADQRYFLNVESLANLADLGGQSAGVGTVAGEHFNRHRTAVGGAQQAIDDLHLAAFAVSVVTECGKRATLSFDIGGGDIVENQGAAAQVAIGEAFLDPLLPFSQPVQHIEHFIAVYGIELEQSAQRAVGGLRRQRSGSGELGGWREDAGDDGRQCQVALTRGGSMQNTRQSDLRSQTEHSRDMSVRQRALDGECLVEGAYDDAAFQKHADGIDDECRGFGEVGEGFAFDAFAVAFGVAQQDRWAAVAVGNGFDVNSHSCFL